MNNIKPGIHRNVPAAEYHSWPFASASRLNRLYETCPAVVRYEMGNPKEPTPAMLLGSAIHTAVLEPEKFAGEVVAAPDVDRRTKEGKAEWAAFVAASAGKIVLSADDYAKAVAIGAAVRRLPVAAAALERRTETELTAIYDDPESGVRCKCRMDGVIVSPASGLAVLLDLKTTASAHPRQFQKSIAEFGYHRQFALYQRAAAANGIVLADVVIVAIEKNAPYPVACYSLDRDDIAFGWEQVQHLLHRWAACKGMAEWPGYSEQVETISLPAWARK